MRSLALLSLAVSPLLISAASAGAQTPSIAGLVRDSAGRPIAAAEVRAASHMTRSDSVGRFFLAFTPRESVTVTIRRMGYESATFTLATAQAIHNDLEVVLHALPFALPEVTVDDPSVRRLTPLAGFDQRRAQGFGVFITRDEIVRRNTYLLSDILRSQRGVIIARSQGRMALRFVTRQSRSCEPLIWLDGQRAPGLDIDAIAAPDVEGIELYQTIATTPGEFVRGAGQFNCGAVVIWTKRPILKTR